MVSVIFLQKRHTRKKVRRRKEANKRHKLLVREIKYASEYASENRIR